MTETQAMTYDAYGRETATSSSQYSASTAKTYNDRGQLATEATTYSGQTYTVTYHYDVQGRPVKLTYPSGREAEYTYDDRQLLKTIKWETAQIEDRSYNDAGMLTGVDRAFVDETRTYNAGSQLTQINNTNVGSQTYTYDLNGNVTSESLSGVMANYSFSTIHAGGPFADGYDAEDRFMRFKRSGVTEDILLTRSNIGNISNVNRNGTNTARGYNTAHGLTTVTGGTTQTYDTDGNTTTLHTNVTAVWDDAGRMRSTTVPAGATAGIQGLNENGYVGGNRIWKKITRSGSVVEHRVHIHAGPNLIAEYNAGVAASTPVQEYVYAGEIDSLVLIRRSDATKYGVTRNRQWSITAMHDLANGNVVERYAYEMTGKRTIYAANGTTVRTTSSYGNNFGYTNRWHDEDSGLMYFRARYYNSLTGVMLTRSTESIVELGMYFAQDEVDKGTKVGVTLVVTPTDHPPPVGLCGSAAAQVQFSLEIHPLNLKRRINGVIAQVVLIEKNIDGKVSQHRYVEFWIVQAGKIINGDGEEHKHDTFQFSGGKIGSVGHWEQHGIVSFYPDGKVPQNVRGGGDKVDGVVTTGLPWVPLSLRHWHAFLGLHRMIRTEWSCRDCEPGSESVTPVRWEIQRKKYEYVIPSPPKPKEIENPFFPKDPGK